MKASPQRRRERRVRAELKARMPRLGGNSETSNFTQGFQLLMVRINNPGKLNGAAKVNPGLHSRLAEFNNVF